MIDINIINGAIAELEEKELTFSNLNKLSTLYNIRDHIQIRAKSPDLPSVGVPNVSDSNFIAVCQRANTDQIWAVLDELMDSIKVLYPKLYESVIDDISRG